jgi:predicted component of type VI protein secretion system
MHVKLKVLRGASAGKEVIVRGPRFFIGRSEECHLRANSDAISRRHCAITVQDDIVRIRDLGSRNGTYVNGTRIDGDHRLEMGDQLRVGPLEFLVTYLVQAKAPAVKEGGSDDMDGLIGDWLSEASDEDPSKTGIASETREFRLDETSRIGPPVVTGQNPTAQSQASAGKGAVAKTNEDKNDRGKKSDAGAGPAVAGKDGETSGEASSAEQEGDDADSSHTSGLQPRRSSQKVAPKDTQEAAAQTLRKFFNRGS